jgi:hypothetical protein
MFISFVRTGSGFCSLYVVLFSFRCFKVCTLLEVSLITWAIIHVGNNSVFLLSLCVEFNTFHFPIERTKHVDWILI